MPELRKRPVVLIVRDGWGHNPNPDLDDHNAVVLGKTPVDDALRAKYPWVQIHTSGEDVGLPDGVMGNSEVGHQNIGAGRVVDQEMMRITRAVRDRSLFEKENLNKAAEHVASTGGTLHLLGLVSDGGVHSHIEHLLSLLDFCKGKGVDGKRLCVHAITDGRDTAPTGGAGYVRAVDKKLQSLGIGRIASVIGRFYAMDRDFRWDRVQQAYDLLVRPDNAPVFDSAEQAVKSYYDNPTDDNRRGDEFITPSRVSASGQVRPEDCIRDGDAVVFFNFRGDRPREIAKVFVQTDTEWAEIKGGGFDRGAKLDNLFFASMTRYEKTLNTQVIFEKPPRMEKILGQHLADLGLKQFRCAESEKHPHVTYFFNDYQEEPHEGERHQEVPSPKHVPTYDQKPEMSAYEVTDVVLEAIRGGEFDFVLVNYANGDMVGHTGSLEAAIRAVETVDECVGRVVDATLEAGGALVVTADHGNCEQMIEPKSGRPHTAHTTYDVDLIVVDDDSTGASLTEDGRLADIAPTVLALLGLEQPGEMTGQSLLP